ncbi:hypothetical protein [Streptomyces sp. NPDC002602]|uniref:hypothetical protein n=1 Tax=Streptomyces sp. NPDC002602 TaxID=3364654 RepID=UPI0036C3C18E
MRDGRQVAVLAALTSDDADSTAALLVDTQPGEPWEQLITTCLTVLCRSALGRPVDRHLAELVTGYLDHPSEHGTTVFDIRLGLTLLDITAASNNAAARRITEDLYQRTSDANDGYAARETLAHPLLTALATNRQLQHCHALLHACALDTGALPTREHDQLVAALSTCDRTIRNSVECAEHPSQSGGQPASRNEVTHDI